jgi:hypothetical protein
VRLHAGFSSPDRSAYTTGGRNLRSEPGEVSCERVRRYFCRCQQRAIEILSFSIIRYRRYNYKRPSDNREFLRRENCNCTVIESLTKRSKQPPTILYSIRLGSIMCVSFPGVGWFGLLGPVPPPAGTGFSVVLLPGAGGISAGGCEAKPGWGTNTAGGMVYPGGDG